MSVVNGKDVTTLQLYHARFCHQDKRHIRPLLLNEFNIKVPDCDLKCEPCIFGKSHRKSFASREPCTEPGELVSADVCGAFDPSYRGYRYSAVFKDHFTKYRYVFFLKQKSDVAEAMESFLAHVNKLGHKVKEVLSDGGLEFDNQAVRKILAKWGVGQRLTSRYTPEQSGASERENRTLVEMARTFRYSNPDQGFPNVLWAEFVQAAAYILNRTGKSSVEGKSPHHLWMGKKPRIKHLRVIGSRCYPHVPTQVRSGTRRQQGVFL